MKKFTILITLCLMIIYSNCLAGTVYTADQVKKIFKKECNIEVIALFDEIYEEYPLNRALTKTDSTNHFYESNLYDCDDIALSVKAIVIRHILEIYKSGGAVMIGIASMKKKSEKYGHVVNICIINKKVYIYDQQVAADKNFKPITYFIKQGYIFEFIIM